MPFDYEGPQRVVESTLTENKNIGMSWAVLDYDRMASGICTATRPSRGKVTP